MKKTFYKSEVREVILIRTQLHRIETILASENGLWHTTPVFLPGVIPWTEVLVGYNQWGHKESDATEQLRTLGPYNVVGRV